MRKEATYPQYVSEQAKSLLKALLEKNPEKRIGFNKEFEEVKSHDFFKGVIWDKVLMKDKSHMRISPLTPKLDHSYFDQEFVEQIPKEKLKELYEEEEEILTHKGSIKKYLMTEKKKSKQAQRDEIFSNPESSDS